MNRRQRHPRRMAETQLPERLRYLWQHFEVLSDRARARWVFDCRRCERRWTLPKSDRHGGNVLALLDHAYSHGA